MINDRWPIEMRETWQFLGANPENEDDEGIAESHQEHWNKEHDDQLIPGKCDPGTVADAVIGTGYDDHVLFVTVVQALCCVLSVTQHHRR